MTIAIDIDSVLVDTEKYIKEKGVGYFGKEPVNQSGFNVSDIFAVSKSDEQAFWDVYYHDYITNGPIYEGAADATKSLHDLGHQILLVSARYYRPDKGFATEKEYQDVMRAHLQKNGIYFDEIYSEPRPKVPAVSKYKIDVFIEDDPVNVIALSEHTHVLIKDTSYNKDILLPNTTRFSSWNDVVDLIQKNN